MIATPTLPKVVARIIVLLDVDDDGELEVHDWAVLHRMSGTQGVLPWMALEIACCKSGGMQSTVKQSAE